MSAYDQDLLERTEIDADNKVDRLCREIYDLSEALELAAELVTKTNPDAARTMRDIVQHANRTVLKV